MTRETRNLLLIAVIAGLCGLAAAFIAKGPGPLWRTELGQRALQAAIQKPAPEGMQIARRDEPLPPVEVSTLDGQRIDAALDDRGLRPGAMFADIELIGIPHRVVVSERGLAAGTFEYRARRATEAENIGHEDLFARLRA